MKATIYDVAGVAGVSIATVSRVINGTARVRPATADKVISAIEALDFVLDVNAVRLAKIPANYQKKA